MTIQREVEEQVIAEWMSLDGYFVETNIQLKGSKEVDIVAVKVKDGQIIVKHVEVGILEYKYETNLKTVQDKFGEKIRKDIKEFVARRITLSENYVWDYRCEYIFTYLAKKQVQRMTEVLAQDTIELTSFDTILLERIPLTMKKWRERAIESGRVTQNDPQRVMLPRKYRILYIVDRCIETFQSISPSKG